MKTTVTYQRIESIAILAALFYFYVHLHFSIILFFVLLFAIDLFMAGYLVNNRFGAHSYNIGHSYTIPAILIMAGAATPSRLALSLGIIWAAHIAFDRSLGYGLKLESGFQDTHLGKIGKTK